MLVNVLVINVGSTTVKFDLYDMTREQVVVRGTVARAEATDAVGPAVDQIAARLQASSIDAIGHRVVHGGEHALGPTRIDARVEAIIAECSAFAPLHNPASLAGIRAAQLRWPNVPHVAVFDTAYHATMPEHAFVYGLPRALYLEHGIRRYGFHGPSHQFMAACAAETLQTAPSMLRLVTVHLGGGSSVAAIAGGASIDTSMGMTPLEGLVMGTRSGDLDPAIPILLARRGFSPDQIEDLLNRRSGLAGIAGGDGDFRELERAAASGDTHARLAIEVFVHRVRKYIGAYAAELGGADAVVITGGIGEHSASVREQVCEPLGFMGVALDAAKNSSARPSEHGGVIDISAAHATTRVLVVHTEEEKMIARDVVRCIAGDGAAIRGANARALPVDVSARHVHLSSSDRDVLFGKGYELARRRDITQPGQYVTRETVDVIGPRGELRGVAIINPLRAETQVELARTDAVHLGIDPPLRESGHLEGTPGIRLRGPRGEVALERGVIIAQRHIHMSPLEATRFEVANGDRVRVRIAGPRELTLGDVVVRVRDDFALDLHLDTDEANAAGIQGTGIAALVDIEHHPPG